MKTAYIITILRPGLADLPELVRCESSEVAAAVVKALLDCNDPNMASVTVAITKVMA